jgi:hypothetical protein
VPKLVWRVKLVAELRPGVMTETEVARVEVNEQAGVVLSALAPTSTICSAGREDHAASRMLIAVRERQRTCSRR